MYIHLQHKKAFVGGATSGLGKAIAMELAAAGASVTLVSRNEEKLRDTLAQLAVDLDQKHDYLAVDFTDFMGYKSKIENYFNEHTVDILVNNTNGPAAGTALEKNSEDYRQAFDLLFQSASLTTSLALPHMQRQQWGRIINLTSRTVQEPVDNLVLSNAMRSAVTAWAKSLAGQVAKDNITVNNILTGNFFTERLKSLIEGQAAQKHISFEHALKQMEQQIPAGRTGRPEEMGYLVAFLASEYAAYITGTNITIDGGLMRSL